MKNEVGRAFPGRAVCALAPILQEGNAAPAANTADDGTGMETQDR